MREKNLHAELVEEWAVRTLTPLSYDEVVQVFNHVFAKIWSHAELILGAITMNAAADRVYSVSHQFYPWVDPSKFSRDGLEASLELKLVDQKDLTSGMKFILAELLTVLGNLTGQIINPKLHAFLRCEVNDNPSSDVSQNDQNSKNASPRGRDKR